MKKSPKKGLLIFAGVLAAVFAVLTVFGPFLVYKVAKQEEVADEYNYSESFLNSYEDVRANVQKRITTLKKDGVKVKYTEYAIDESDNLYIDNFYIPALKEQKNLIVLTTGVHGMEGYIGSVMLDVFFAEVYPTLDMTDTGVLVVANVNPYGMKHYRRYNENNVDLNRNFILDWETFDLSSNKEYPKVDTFLQPTGKIGNALWHEVGFYLNLGVTAITDKYDTMMVGFEFER